MKKQKIIIDTDPGVDDAMAIIYASLSPELELVGLTTIFGNVTIDMATRNALALSEFAGLDIPVAKGASTPLVKELEEPSTYVHGPEGFGDMPALAHKGEAIDVPAYQFIIDMANAYPGEIVLCPIGPLTNIALALEHDPEIINKIKSVVVMGGSVDLPGNVTKFAEANIWQDPHAARKVFSADWDVSMIGLDVTHQTSCSSDDLAELAKFSPKFGGFLNFISQFYIRFYQGAMGVDGCHMHDATAVIAIGNDRLFDYEETAIDVILDGEQAARTVRGAGASQPKVKVATGINASAVQDKFMNMIKSGA